MNIRDILETLITLLYYINNQQITDLYNEKAMEIISKAFIRLERLVYYDY